MLHCLKVANVGQLSDSRRKVQVQILIHVELHRNCTSQRDNWTCIKSTTKSLDEHTVMGATALDVKFLRTVLLARKVSISADGLTSCKLAVLE